MPYSETAGVLKLNDSLKIGTGAERACYIHPLDPGLCVKVRYVDRTNKQPQNEADYAYYSFLEKRNIDWDHIAKCRGWVKTNLGDGLVFDLVRGSDGAPCKSLENLISEGIPLYSFLGELDYLYKYLLKFNILPADLRLDNIMLKPDMQGECRLVIVDGLGNRNFFSWATNRINSFGRLRISKKYNRFLFKARRDGLLPEDVLVPEILS